MEESVFREKALKRVNSPEELDRYLKVTNPGLWIFLLAIVVLLSGVIIWSYFGKIEGYVKVGCKISNGEFSCVMDQSDYSRLCTEDILRIEDEEHNIPSLSFPSLAADKVDVYLLELGEIESDNVFVISGESNLADGYYAGKIVTETVSPISFIID